MVTQAQPRRYVIGIKPSRAGLQVFIAFFHEACLILEPANLPPFSSPPYPPNAPPTFLSDERQLCSGSRDASVRTWDVETGRCTASSKVPRNLVTCLKYLPGESHAASVVQGGEDLRLRVWDVREAGLRPSMTVEGYTFFPVGSTITPHVAL